MKNLPPERQSRRRLARWVRLTSALLLPLCGLALALGSLLWFATTDSRASGPLFVSPGGSDSGGCSIAAPCRTINYAVTKAAPGDEVRVAAGTYAERLTLGKDVTLRGGFTTTNWFIPDPVANVTRMDAQGGGRVLEVQSGSSVTVTGFHLTGGSVLAANGGGVLNQGDLTLVNCRIYANDTNQFGGGIANAGTLRLVRVEVYSNAATTVGGGLANLSGGVASLVSSRVFSNRAGDGGGIYLQGGSLSLVSSLIYTNSVEGDFGGAVLAEDGALDLVNATLFDNSAANGAGLSIASATVSITNSLVVSNVASLNGGGVFTAGGVLRVAYSDFHGNAAAHIANAGGAVDPTTLDPTNRVSDPQFVDAEGFDLHLAPGSPAIDSGVSLGSVMSDFEGDGRPFGNGFDRGADEWTAASDCYARVDGGRVYTDLQAAVDVAPPGGLVQVAGRCAGVTTRAGVTQTLYLSQTLTVRGGYTVTDWVTPRYPTTLDAQGEGRGVYVAAGAVITLENLRVTGGAAGQEGGGGVYVSPNAGLTLHNNVIYRNATSGPGGGVYNNGGWVVLRHNTIYSNTADYGGGVYGNPGGTTTLRSSLVVSNTATNNGGGVGGELTESDYNLFYGNLPNHYGAISPGAHDLVDAEPRLQSPDGADFHLAWDSPAVNAADPATPLTADFEGDLRPQGPRADVGADESPAFAALDLSDAPQSPVVVTDTVQVVGRRITFTHSLTNLGYTPGFTDSVVLSAANSDGWTFGLVGATLETPLVLSTGQRLEFLVVVTVPETVAEPLNNVTTITATSQSNADALDGARDVIVKPGVILAPSITRNADPGEVVTYTHRMTNIGPSDAFTLSMASSRGWGQLVSPTETVTLPYQGSAPVIVRVEVPFTAPANLADVVTVTVASLTYGVSDSITDTTIAKPTTGPRYVRPDGTNLNNNCKDGTMPCGSIAYALGQAAWGDTVYVAQGIYTETDLMINQLVNLRGGYNATFTEQVGDATTTIIDAGGRGRVLRINTAGRPEISDFTLRNAASAGVGGAVYIQGSSAPTLTRLIILASSAARGGGVYVESGSPVVQQVVISGATATARGGGIYIDTGSPTLRDVIISHTTALSGGGIYNQAGSWRAEGLALWDNVAAQGGGLYQAGGSPVISRSRLANNSAVDGGGIYKLGGGLTLWNNVIVSNTATTGSGGGLHHVAGSLSLINNTLAGNRAQAMGGGVYDLGSTTLQVSNTIVAFNQATTGGGIHTVSGGTKAADYNLFYQNSQGDGNLPDAGHSLTDRDPKFVDYAAGDLHITYESPAMDAGDPATFLNRDIDGDLRPVNQGYDIGADEIADCLVRNARTQLVYGILQQAVDEAGDHDTLQIAGVCRGVQARLVGEETLSQTVLISKSLTLEGGYNSSFVPSLGAISVLDAQGMGRVVVITDTTYTTTVVLSQVTLTGGAGGLGGGVYQHAAELVVLGGVITANQATQGGGIYQRAGTLQLGGATTRHATLVAANTAEEGGGVYLAGGVARLKVAALNENAAAQGGGVYVAGGEVHLDHTGIASNTASVEGGGAYVGGGTWYGRVVTLTHNVATERGGGVHNAAGTVALEATLVYSNAAGDGGGIHNATGGALILTNTLVASNTARANGGGLSNASAALSVRHVTFFGNAASSQGGGLYHTSASGAPVINSTLIVGNRAASGGGIYNANVKPAFNYNDVADNTGGDYGGNLSSGDGIGNFAADPAFVSIAPAAPDFLRLSNGSPAQDTADPESPVSDDIDGDPRPSDQGFDVGADEVGGCYVRINGAPPTYGNVQQAVSLAGEGDRILVAGTCQGVNTVVEGDQTLSQTVYLTRTLSVEGGYAADDWSVAHPITQPTTLNALGLGRVVVVSGSAQATLTGLHLTGGSSDAGGGILAAGGVLTVTQSRLFDNVAGQGGGMYVAEGATVVVRGNRGEFGLFGNQAVEGGAVYVAGGQVTLDGNEVYGHLMATRGGAVFHAGGTAVVQNNVLRDNAASRGGAIYADADGLTAWFNTIVRNAATEAGGGIYLAPGGVVATLSNNLVVSNTATTAHGLYSAAPYTLTYHDLYPAANAIGGDARAGVGVLFEDPLLADTDGGDFHLTADSPVVDKGDPAATLGHDFEGDLRPSDQGFDMGADEVSSCRARIVRTGEIFGNVQSAVNHSLPGDVIQVTAGVCRGVHDYDDGGRILRQTVHITHDLTLQGAYLPDFSGLWMLPGGGLAGVTTLDAAGLGRTLLITNGAALTMTGFDLVNGRAGGLGGGPGGEDAGGGVYYHGMSGLLSGVRIISGVATYGGGLFNAGQGLTLTLSVVASNTATYGGGVYNLSDAMVMRAVTVTANAADMHGGGIYNATGAMRLEANWIGHNSVLNGAAGAGGGFYNYDSAALIDRGNRFYANTSAEDGGAIYSRQGALRVYNSIFHANQADDGGAIYVAGGGPGILHNTLYNNAAIAGSGKGGGVYVTACAPAVIENAVFFQNSASAGRAVYAEACAGSPITLGANYYDSDGDVNAVGAVDLGGHIVGGTPGLADVATGDFHLLPSSPLIDAGLTLITVTQDFEGDPRPVNTASDIGADEYSDCLAQIPSGEVFGRIQAALDALEATPSQQLVKVAVGTCYEAITIDKNVQLFGGYARDFSAMGEGASVVDARGLGTRVVTVTDAADGTQLHHFELRNGDAGSGDGGGVWSEANPLSLNSVSVYSNTATRGGGVYVSAGGSLALNDTGVRDNHATDGGGVYIAAGAGLDIYGGGVAHNLAGNAGGGIYLGSGAEVEITGGAPIEFNTANTGGGIYDAGADFYLVNKQVNENTAATGGGIYIAGNGTAQLTNLGLYSNTASVEGGGLYRNATGSAALYHATINSNRADLETGRGGGIYNVGSSMTISASIVTSNTASSGAGIFGASNVNVAYSVQWLNDFVGVSVSDSLEADPHLRETGGDLLYTSPAIDFLPSAASHVLIDRFNQTRPQLCAKDAGRDEYKVERHLRWAAPAPGGVQQSVVPGGTVTYTFSIVNESQNLTYEPETGLGVGTGYTETISATLQTSQGWARIIGVENAANIVVISDTAQFDIAPGATADVRVSVTVPPGTWAGSADETTIAYLAQLCDGGEPLASNSPVATTEVLPLRAFEVLPDNFGAAAPGQTVTYAHRLTNTGNLTDTYAIYPKAGWYSTVELVTPPSGSVSNLPPGGAADIVLAVTIRPEAAAGLTDIAGVVVQNGGASPVQKAAADNTVISGTTGTRYVALNGVNSLVDETSGLTETIEIDYPDNNCTQPLVAPCRTLQHAVAMAAPGDTIKVASGWYTDLVTVTQTGRVLTQTVFVDKSVVIQGGYASDSWNIVPPNHISYPTRLDPQGQGRAVYVTAGVTPTLQWLTLVNGDATGLGGGAGDADAGGNLYNAGADLALNALAVRSGTAGVGGGIYHAGGDLQLQNSVLVDNQAVTNGGALYLAAGDATVRSNTFYRNRAGAGGAIYAGGGSAQITNTIFATQTTSGGGSGAVHVNGASAGLDYNLFFDNSGGDLAGSGHGANLLNSDPQFLDPSADPPNLDLGSDSPARETGGPTPDANVGLMRWDYANRLRWLGPRIDIGAYEYEVQPRVAFEPDVHLTTTTSATQTATLVISHSLTNTGDISDTYVITYAASQPWPVDFDPQTEIVLTPGQTASVVVTLTVPPGTGGLTQTVVFTAASIVPEQASDTVRDSVFVLFTPAFELVADESGIAGPYETITYTHRLTNTGNGQDTYHFVATPTGIWPLTVTVTPNQVTLPVSGTAGISVAVTLPGPTRAISGSVGVAVIEARSAFSAEVRAAVTDTTTVRQVQGLRLTPDRVGSAAPGQAVVFTHTLEQLGNYTETATITPLAETAPPWEVSVPDVVELPPGGLITFSMRVTAPLDSLAGITNVTRISAALQTSPTVSASAVDTTTTALQRGVVIGPPLAGAARPGEVVTYTHMLTNLGNLTDTFDLTLAYGAFTGTLVGQTPITVAAFATAPLTVTVAVPNVLSGTTDVLTLTATSVNSPTTISGTVTDTTTAGYLPGVHIAPDREGTGQVGQVITYHHVVTNLGNYTDTIALMYVGEPPAWPVQVTPAPEGGFELGPGRSAPVTVTVTVGNGAASHLAVLTATLQSDARISDSVRITTTLGLPTPPHLVVPPDGSITRTQDIEFRWGDAGATAYVLQLDGEPFTVTGTLSETRLGEGVHTWTVASIDAFDRRGPFTDTWMLTVDVTPPIPPQPLRPLTGTVEPSKTVTFGWVAATDNYTFPLTYTLVVSGSGGSEMGQTVAITEAQMTVAADGLYTWTVQATDAAGNESGWYIPPITFYVDADGPDPATLIAPEDGLVTNTHAITLAWQDPNQPPVTTYTVRVADQVTSVRDAGTAAGKVVVSPTLLATDGVYTWNVQPVDAFGRAGGLSETRTFTADVTPPPSPLLVAPISGTYTSATQITFDWTAVNDNLSGVAGYTLVVNDMEQAAPTDQLPLTLGEGVFTWTVRARDAAGNTGSQPEAWRLVVDTTPPSVPLPVAPAADETVLTTTVVFTWEASSDNFDALGYPLTYTLVVTPDNGSPSFWSGSTTSTQMMLGGDGAYHWSVRARDGAGNASAYSDPIRFYVDASPPGAPELINPPDRSLTNTRAIEFAWRDLDVPRSPTYTLRISDTVTTVDTTMSPTVLPADGIYTWTVGAIDQFNRPGPLAATRVFTVDTIAPDVPTLQLPISGTISPYSFVTFAWQVPQDNLSGVVSYTLSIAGDARPCASVSCAANVPDGVHTWTVRAHDAAGNAGADADPAWQLIVDTRSPGAPTPITPTGGIVLTDTAPIVLEWLAPDDEVSGVVTFTVRVTNSSGSLVQAVTVVTPATATTLTLVTDDDYTWSVWATDAAGHTSAPGGPAAFTMDAAPPDVPGLIAPSDGTLTNTNEINLIWSRTRQTTHYDVRLGGAVEGMWQVADSGIAPVVSPTVLADGVYTWTVEAVDRFDRRSGLAASRAFTVDTTGPSVPTPIHPPLDGLQLARPVVFSWLESLDTTSGVAGYEVAVDGPTQAYAFSVGNVTIAQHALGPDGRYTWTVRARDAAGNRSNWSEATPFVLDADPPPVPTLVSPPDATFTQDPRVRFRWAAVGDVVTYTVRINSVDYAVLAPTTELSFATPLSDGLYTWSVQALDTYSRTAGFAPSRWVRVDTRPPAAPMLLAPPDGAVTTTHAILLDWTDVVSDADGGPERSTPLTYTLSISGQPLRGVGASQAWVDLAEGAYTWTVWAHDLAGNVGLSAPPFTFTVAAPVYRVHLPVVARQTPPVGPTPTPTPTRPGPTPTATPTPASPTATPVPQPRPDLVVDAITLERSGGGYTVRVTVRNQSSVAVTYGNNFHVTLYVDPSVTPTYDSVYDMTPTYMWGVQGSWFGAGQSRTLETKVSFAAVGTHTLWAWADPYRVVGETSDTNNGRQLVQDVAVLSADGDARVESLPSGPAPTPTNVP